MVGGSSGGASRSPLCCDSGIPGALGAFKGMEHSQLPESSMTVQTFGCSEKSVTGKKTGERGRTNTWG